MTNQNPEQIARNHIDRQLLASGWIIQDKTRINLNAAAGIAVREYQTDVEPADYALFVDKKPVGIIEAKRAEEAVHLTMHEDQSAGYAQAKLKYLDNEPLPFVYESAGEVTRLPGSETPVQTRLQLSPPGDFPGMDEAGKVFAGAVIGPAGFT